MKKFTKLLTCNKTAKLFAVVLALLCTVAFVACNGDTPKQLKMGELSYDNAIKTVSWDKVTNASGYELKIGADGTYSASGIIESGNKMQYVLSVADNTYTIYVIAKGDGTNYSDSVAKSKNITVSTENGKTEQQLTAPTIEFDSDNGLVYWAIDANASGYSLTVNGTTKSTVQKTNRYEFQLEAYGEFVIRVKALGGKQTETTIYTDSTEAARTIEYTAFVELERAVNLRIGDEFSGKTARPVKNASDLYNMNIIIDINGKVYATWFSNAYYKIIYAEYQIPLTASQINNPDIEEWISSVSSMTVSTNPSISNFNFGGTLLLSDMQILFDFALNQSGSQAEKDLLTGAQVVMVKEAIEGESSHRFVMWIKASDGKIYERSMQYEKTVSLKELASSATKNSTSFIGDGLDSFAPANNLFKIKANQQ